MKQKYKYILLTKGYKAIVDEENYNELSKYKWQVSINDNKYVRAVRTINTGDKRTSISMHREIMNANKNEVVDHINGNELDNRKINLRLCTNAQNIQNRTCLQKDNTSGYKGVFRSITKGRWFARLCSNGKQIYLGTFKNKRLAAKAYDKAAIKIFGEFEEIEELQMPLATGIDSFTFKVWQKQNQLIRNQNKLIEIITSLQK